MTSKGDRLSDRVTVYNFLQIIYLLETPFGLPLDTQRSRVDLR